MASTPRLPERQNTAMIIGDFHLSEFTADKAGSVPPFGELADEFPLPPDRIWYRHPGPESRPHLAEGR